MCFKRWILSKEEVKKGDRGINTYDLIFNKRRDQRHDE
jgi:hypothetical protein